YTTLFRSYDAIIHQSLKTQYYALFSCIFFLDYQVQQYTSFLFVLYKKIQHSLLKEGYTSFIKEGLCCFKFLYNLPIYSSSSSSSAPTSSGSALSSSVDGSRSSSVGAVTVATVVSSSSRIS